MAKRLLTISGLLVVLGGLCTAQVTIPDQCPYSPAHKHGLACLIPDVTATGTSQNLANFNTTVAQVIGQLPLAVPVSGFVLGIDKNTGVPFEENQNLGSVITERGDTIGKYKLFLGFTYQHFTFQTVDGTKLNDLPIVFATNATATNPNEIGYAFNTLSANVSQYTAIAAFGLTNRVDLSLTLPFDRVSLSASSSNGIVNVNNSSTSANPPSCVALGTNCPGTLTPYAADGSASGVGDLLMSVKANVIKAEKSRLAFGVETRFPTGDAYNLLGSGAYGVKPFFVFSRHDGRFTPHVNVGYQWNGFSVLRLNPCHFEGTCPTLSFLRLPDSLEYSAGADIGIVRKLSLVADLVGQRYFNAPRITPATTIQTPQLESVNPARPATQQSVGLANSDYNVNNLGLGLKLNPIGHLIVSANALIRLDSGGLRPARFVPLVGVSYRF